MINTDHWSYQTARRSFGPILASLFIWMVAGFTLDGRVMAAETPPAQAQPSTTPTTPVATPATPDETATATVTATPAETAAPAITATAPIETPSAINVEEAYEAGRTAYENNDWFAAMPPLNRAAAAGHQPAMVMLGIISSRAAETETALEWYHKAAKAGSLEGAYWLGTLLSNEPAPKKAAVTAVTAATATQPNAATPTEIPLIHGPEEALKWLSVAAEGNYPPAMLSMADIAKHGKLGQLKDQKVALDWLKRAADLDFTPAMKELAKINANGLLGVAPNPAEAQRWQQAVSKIEQETANRNKNAKTQKKAVK